MKIEDILESTTKISDLYTFIKQATCDVDWQGRRIISIPNIEGVVTIEAIADKFLKFPFFIDLDKENTLEEQFCMCHTWEKIEELYRKSDEQLEETHVYWLIVPVSEKVMQFSKAHFTSLNIILGKTQWGKEEYVFQFTEVNYKKIWPDRETTPKTVIFLSHDIDFSKRLIATKSMVKQVLSKKYQELFKKQETQIIESLLI